MVVRFDALELDVDKVFRIERAGQVFLWLDLLLFAFEVVLVEKPTSHETADGYKVFRSCRLFCCGCFCGVKPGLQRSDRV